MHEPKMPFKKMIFVCAHRREGEAACDNPDRGECAGMNVVEKLREEVKKKGLKGKIRVVKSGCLDVCAKGPNLMIYDETGRQSWHSRLTPRDVEDLIRSEVS